LIFGDSTDGSRREMTLMSDRENHRILIIGAGGLGVPATMALARAHVSDFELIDPDPVELSNLPRQIIYRASDIGIPKVTAAARALHQDFPGVSIRTQVRALTGDNAAAIIAACGFVIDATDDPVTKFLINDTCIALGRPFVYAGVLGMTGQAMTVLPRRTACLRCLFEEPPSAEETASCRDAGIIGPVAGTIGEIEALEAMRSVGGLMPALAGNMLTYDAISSRIRLTPIAARAGCACGAADAAGATPPAR
jgi:molybdopterin-synthase adenylyltransferase